MCSDRMALVPRAGRTLGLGVAWKGLEAMAKRFRSCLEGSTWHPVRRGGSGGLALNRGQRKKCAGKENLKAPTLKLEAHGWLRSVGVLTKDSKEQSLSKIHFLLKILMETY